MAHKALTDAKNKVKGKELIEDTGIIFNACNRDHEPIKLKYNTMTKRHINNEVTH